MSQWLGLPVEESIEWMGAQDCLSYLIRVDYVPIGDSSRIELQREDCANGVSDTVIGCTLRP